MNIQEEINKLMETQKVIDESILRQKSESAMISKKIRKLERLQESASDIIDNGGVMPVMLPNLPPEVWVKE